MNYYEYTFNISPNEETFRDILSALLAEEGFESFVENGNGLTAYVREENGTEERVRSVIREYPVDTVTITYKSSFIRGKDWNEEWEKNFFQPILIDNRCAIHSSFHKDVPQLEYNITIDPKMAFGTGHHETTYLMVSYLLDLNVENKSFLDMGCGTAVLAILASMKRATPVTAIDIDEWAYNNSLENSQLNRVSEIEVRLGGAERIAEKYDIIFANINRNILLNDIRIYAKFLYPEGKLFVSGFYEEDQKAITEECMNNGLRFVSSKQKNNWTAMEFVQE